MDSLDVNPEILAESLSTAPSLTSLRLRNCTLNFGSYKYALIQSQDAEFRVAKFRALGWELEVIYEYVDGQLVAATIPYQHIGRFKVRKLVK
jgi:hypothetical protein